MVALLVTNYGGRLIGNGSVIQGRYFQDILDQPRALDATARALQASPALTQVSELLKKRKFDRLVLTGMGSSYFGLHPLAIEVAESGWTPILLETSELIHYYPRLLGESTLVVAISQSGQSAETLRLLDLRSAGHAAIGITNTPGSPLATLADISLLTDAGNEYSVSCKTYLSSLMALSLLSAGLCGRNAPRRLEEFSGAAEAVRGYVANWKAHVDEFCEILRGVRHLFLVGRGASLASASTGALTIKESDHFHAEAMSSAAFRHGPFEMLSSDTFVGIFAGHPRTQELHERLFQDLRAAGARSVLIGKDSETNACRIPGLPTPAMPIAEILPVQMMTLALAAMANREAGKFERAAKITAAE